MKVCDVLSIAMLDVHSFFGCMRPCMLMSRMMKGRHCVYVRIYAYLMQQPIKQVRQCRLSHACMYAYTYVYMYIHLHTWCSSAPKMAHPVRTAVAHRRACTLSRHVIV